MRRLWIVAVLILVVGVAWRVMGSGRRQAAPPPADASVPVEVRPVETTTLFQTVVAGGSVAGVEDVTVIAKATGRIEAVLVKEGDNVRAGQVLVRLENGELAAGLHQVEANLAAAQSRLQMMLEGARPQERAQVEDQVHQAEANLASAQSRLQMLQQGARPQERAQVEAAVAQAKANYETAKANLERMKMLYETGAVSKGQFEAAQLQHDVALSQYEASKQQWNMTEIGPRPEEIEMARSQVQAARAQRDMALQQRAMIQQGPRTQEIEMARAQVAQAQAAVAFARLQLANATITAPFAGTVTHRFVDPGQLVTVAPGGGMVVTVAQIDTVNVNLDVSETDLARVKPGQVVALHMDAYPDRSFAGMVREVGLAADPRVRVFKVKVAVPNADHVLKPGMFARGEITVGRHEQALVIPRDAVVSDTGQPSVFVADAGKARIRKVRLGVMSGPIVEVLEGLAKGDAVIVAGQSGLTDGAAIAVR